jgi:hypothetical protein
MKREAYMNRMKIVATLFVSVLTLSFVGCKPIPFINSLFSEEECLFEPQLIGDWVKINNEDKSYWLIHDFDPQTKSYHIDCDGQNETGWLGKIGDAYYLDLVSVAQNELPNKGQGELGIIATAQGHVITPAVIPVSEELYLDFRTDQSNPVVPDLLEKIKFKIQPMHKIYRLSLENNQLAIWYLDDEKFESQIEKGMIKISHQNEPFPLITADRSELQEFLRAYDKSGELFNELGTYYRAVNQ